MQKSCAIASGFPSWVTFVLWLHREWSCYWTGEVSLVSLWSKLLFFFLTVCFLFCRLRSCWRTMCLQPEGSQDEVWEFVCLTLALLVTLRFSSELSFNSLWWSFVRNDHLLLCLHSKTWPKRDQMKSSSLEEGHSLAISVVAIFACENIQYQRKHLSKDKENQLAWNDLMMKDLRNLFLSHFFLIEIDVSVA